MSASNEAFTEQLKRYFNTMLDKSHDELVREAKLCTARAVRALEQAGIERRASRTIVLIFIASALTVDGDISENEKALIDEVFGEQVSSIIETMAGRIGEAQYAQMDRAADALPDDGKMCFCRLALAISAVDKVFSERETAYLVKLFS